MGNGFRITAPADTTQRTLTVYVDAYHAQGKMVAHLSDASSPDYTDSTLNSVGNTLQGAYTFIYKAASSGQTLSVTFTNMVDQRERWQHCVAGGHAGGKRRESGFLSDGGAEHAIGGGGGKHDLHGDRDGAERFYWEHRLRGERTADGSDGDL